MPTTTKHATDCSRAFANYDPACDRCNELASGAKPRAGWGDARREREEASRRALAAHVCTQRNCGPVCTAFDW